MKAAKWKAITARLAIVISIFSMLTLAEYPAQALAPTVVDVSALNPNGIYGVNDTFTVTVQFSETVFVTGTPRIIMAFGILTYDFANYISGSGTNTLSFLFTSGYGATAANLEYNSTSALSLNGGTIKNGAGTNATLTLPTPGALHSLSANKQLQFENFGNQYVGVTNSDSTHLTNLMWSNVLNKPVTSINQKIVSLSPTTDTYTVLFDVGELIDELQIYGDSIYWLNNFNAIRSSPLASPNISTLYTHSTTILAFTRTANLWVFVDSSRRLYTLSTDGRNTLTLITTLSSAVVDLIARYTMMFPTPETGKVIWTSQFSGLIYKIDIATGVAAQYLDLNKCFWNTRGYLRLSDGSEYYTSYPGLGQTIAHRWPDGHLTCSAVLPSTALIGSITSDGTNLIGAAATPSSADKVFVRYTPFNTTWYPVNSFDPSVSASATSLSTPSLFLGGFISFKGVSVTVTSTASVDGLVTFTANGKRIANCINKTTVSRVATCTWKPTVQGAQLIRAVLKPSNGVLDPSTSGALNLVVIRRTTTR
ncbi:MAG: hypothetical protein ACKOXI_03195 [Candidatus Planktophila sp.]